MLRSLCYLLGVTIVAAASIVTGCLAVVALFGIGIALLLSGNVIWFVLWLLFGTMVISVAFGLLRAPFLILGGLLMAIGMRGDDRY